MTSAHAQDKDRPNVDTSFLKEYAETRGYMLGRPVKPKISPDGKTVLFLRGEPKTPKLKLFEFDVVSGKTRELLSPELILKGGEEDLTPEEKARRERQRVSVGGFADYHLSPGGSQIMVMLSGKIYLFDRETEKVRQLKTGPGTILDPKWSPYARYVSYVRNYDVMAYDLENDKELSVTTGGTAEKTHGIAEFVAQEEMGRYTGYWWSPDEKYIAYTEADHAGVERWWIADPLKPDAKPVEQFYPRPGKKNVAVRLGYVPIRGGKTQWIEWDREKFEYLTRVAWGVSELVFQVQTRDQSGLVTMSHDVTAGSSGSLSVWSEDLPRAELDRVFIDITKAGVAVVGCRPVEDYAEANKPPPPGEGPYVLALLHFKGEDFRMISGHGRLRRPIAYDEKGERVFVESGDDPTQIRIAVIGIGADNPGHEFVIDRPGIHSAVFSKDHSSAVVTSTDLKGMPKARLIKADADFATLGELPSVAVEPPFEPNVTVEKLGDYWTAVVRPRDFDPKKEYPVIVDVYGGPKHTHVVQAMRNWLVPQWLADQGFIVVAIDNRGTPGRGRDWEASTYQKLGTVTLQGQVEGLKLLGKKHAEMDMERVGIVGWSFGGYMAANAVLREPDLFKAAVAGAPVTDWEDYDTHYTERYMGLLPESQKAYDEASLIPLASGLRRPLLLVHGTADDNVYYRHTLKLADALFRAGREFETLPLPGITHMYTADPKVTERLWERNVRFFQTHLGKPTDSK